MLIQSGRHPRMNWIGKLMKVEGHPKYATLKSFWDNLHFYKKNVNNNPFKLVDWDFGDLQLSVICVENKFFNKNGMIVLIGKRMSRYQIC